RTVSFPPPTPFSAERVCLRRNPRLPPTPASGLSRVIVHDPCLVPFPGFLALVPIIAEKRLVTAGFLQSPPRDHSGVLRSQAPALRPPAVFLSLLLTLLSGT